MGQIPRGYVVSLASTVEAFCRLLGGQRRRHDDLLPGLPVDRTAHPVGVRGLQSLEDAQQFVHVAAKLHRVVKQRAHIALGIDHKDAADRRRIAGHLVHQAIGLRHALIEVRDHGKLDLHAGDRLELADPRNVRVDRVDRDADQLHVELLEVFLPPGKLDELRRADGREVRGMREQHHPLALGGVVAQPDGAVRAVGLEVRRGLKNAGNAGFAHRCLLVSASAVSALEGSMPSGPVCVCGQRRNPPRRGLGGFLCSSKLGYFVSLIHTPGHIRSDSNAWSDGRP
jgi:hypothetical protein